MAQTGSGHGNGTAGAVLRRVAARGLVAGAVGVVTMTVAEKLEQRVGGRPDSEVPARTLARVLGRPDGRRAGGSTPRCTSGRKCCWIPPPIDLVHDLVYPGRMIEVGVHEAKTYFSKLLRRVAGGEEVVITRGGEPVARLVPTTAKRRRVLGRDAGRITIADDFDAPLPAAVLADFEA
jgi:prevent-host-death family protein